MLAGDESSIIDNEGRSDSQSAIFIISYIIVVNWTLVQVSVAILIDQFIQATYESKSEALQQARLEAKSKAQASGVLDSLHEEIMDVFTNDLGLTSRLKRIFQELDKDGSGTLDPQEFCTALTLLDLPNRISMTPEDFHDFLDVPVRSYDSEHVSSSIVSSSKSECEVTTSKRKVEFERRVGDNGTSDDRDLEFDVRSYETYEFMGGQERNRSLEKDGVQNAIRTVDEKEFQRVMRHHLQSFVERQLNDAAIYECPSRAEKAQMRWSKMQAVVTERWRRSVDKRLTDLAAAVGADKPRDHGVLAKLQRLESLVERLVKGSFHAQLDSSQPVVSALRECFATAPETVLPMHSMHVEERPESSSFNQGLNPTMGNVLDSADKKSSVTDVATPTCVNHANLLRLQCNLKQQQHHQQQQQLPTAPLSSLAENSQKQEHVPKPQFSSPHRQEKVLYWEQGGEKSTTPTPPPPPLPKVAKIGSIEDRRLAASHAASIPSSGGEKGGGEGGGSVFITSDFSATRSETRIDIQRCHANYALEPLQVPAMAFIDGFSPASDLRRTVTYSQVNMKDVQRSIDSGTTKYSDSTASYRMSSLSPLMTDWTTSLDTQPSQQNTTIKSRLLSSKVFHDNNTWDDKPIHGNSSGPSPMREDDGNRGEADGVLEDDHDSVAVTSELGFLFVPDDGPIYLAQDGYASSTFHQ